MVSCAAITPPIFPRFFRRHHLQSHRCAQSQFACYFQRAADSFCPLAHSSQSIMARRRFKTIALRESASIVAHHKRNFCRSIFKLDGEMSGSGMLLHIMDGFLAHAEEFALHVQWYGPVGPVKAEGRLRAVSVRLFGGAAQLNGERVFAGVLRSQGPDGLARFSQAFAHILTCCIEVLDSGLRVVSSQKLRETSSWTDTPTYPCARVSCTSRAMRLRSARTARNSRSARSSRRRSRSTINPAMSAANRM